jgi:hypothetical protein
VTQANSELGAVEELAAGAADADEAGSLFLSSLFFAAPTKSAVGDGTEGIADTADATFAPGDAAAGFASDAGMSTMPLAHCGTPGDAAIEVVSALAAGGALVRPGDLRGVCAAAAVRRLDTITTAAPGPRTRANMTNPPRWNSERPTAGRVASPRADG